LAPPPGSRGAPPPAGGFFPRGNPTTRGMPAGYFFFPLSGGGGPPPRLYAPPWGGGGGVLRVTPPPGSKGPMTQVYSRRREAANFERSDFQGGVRSDSGLRPGHSTLPDVRGVPRRPRGRVALSRVSDPPGLGRRTLGSPSKGRLARGTIREKLYNLSDPGLHEGTHTV